MIFTKLPNTLLEDWTDEYCRLIINPHEVQRLEKRRNNNNDELEDQIVNVIEADTLLIPKPCTYENIVEAIIRTRYTVSDELGILRQRDSKPSEFAEYNEFIEYCKSIAKFVS